MDGCSHTKERRFKAIARRTGILEFACVWIRRGEEERPINMRFNISIR